MAAIRSRQSREKKGPNLIAIFVGLSILLSIVFAFSSIKLLENDKLIAQDAPLKEFKQDLLSPDIAIAITDTIPTDADDNPIPISKSSTTSTTEQEPMEPNYHLIFSTDCSGYQHWQSYLLFYNAYKVKQPGTVTRIASGCSQEEEIKEQEFQNKIAQHMSTDFKIHFTPVFSSVKDGTGKVTGNYSFFNKPFGVLHWMENAEGIHQDDVIILMDPDQVLTRPITNDFTNREENLLVGDDPKTTVTHGTPFGQKYGLAAQWRHFDIDTITGTKDSPAKEVDQTDGMKHYPVGPPYLATAKDMHQIALKWSEFAPGVHAEYPHLLAEMYAYCIAAAHLKLPHQVVTSLMVSDTGGGSGGWGFEGWELIHRIDDDKVCNPSVLDGAVLPSVLHFCQRYMVGKYFFGKRKVPHNIFTCESPLLEYPPEDIATKYDYFIPPPPHKPVGEKKELNKGQAKMNAFMICALTRAVNEAAVFYQEHNCDVGKKAGEALDLWDKKLIKQYPN